MNEYVRIIALLAIPFFTLCFLGGLWARSQHDLTMPGDWANCTQKCFQGLPDYRFSCLRECQDDKVNDSFINVSK
jgi:hypothetical protein